MPRRETSRDRLERLQAEKAAEEREKTEKKAAKKKAPAKRKAAGRKRKISASVRLKLVWAVCKAGGEIVETFPYPKKEEAQATAARMSAAGRADFIVRPEKVPMDEPV